MSRRHKAVKKVILPDVKYNNVLLSKFINCIMEQGKKALAENIVYNAFDLVEKKHKLSPIEVFNEAINIIKPSIEVTSVRIGGANYQVPTPVSVMRGNALAVRWLIKAAKGRSEKSMSEKLAEELYEASQSRGVAFKKSEDTRKMAEANKAFSHFSPKRGA